MNRFEMFLKLMENPKRQAKSNDNYTIYFDGMYFKSKNLDRNVLACLDKEETWKIIEPQKKLREMDFGEVIHIRAHKLISNLEIKSVLTGKDFNRDVTKISKEEYMGKWTVEGVYEDK